MPPCLTRDFHGARITVVGGLSLGKRNQRIGEADGGQPIPLRCLRELEEGVIRAVAPQGDQHAFGRVEDPVGAAAPLRRCMVSSHFAPKFSGGGRPHEPAVAPAAIAPTTSRACSASPHWLPAGSTWPASLESSI